MSRICDLLGIDIPIIQAPTGSIAGPQLAAAVSNAGALGGLGLTWTPAEQAVDAVRETRKLTERPFLVNFALSFEPAALPAVLNAAAPVVTLSWGDPTSYAELIHHHGAKLGVQVGNTDGARRAIGSGADFIICQGIEAGGHVQSTQSLNRLLTDCIAIAGDMPIVAAGGIVDAPGIAGAIKAGANAVMLGTRFVATIESRAHPDYKRLLLESADTALTICFDGGWPHSPHRVLRNSTLESWESAGCPPPGSRPGEEEEVARSKSGEPILRYEDTAPQIGMTGSMEPMALYAGTGVGAIRDIPSAADVVHTLWHEARRLITEE